MQFLRLKFSKKATKKLQEFVPKNIKSCQTKKIRAHIYRSRALKSRGSQLKSVLFLQRLQYISLYFYVVKKSKKAKCNS